MSAERSTPKQPRWNWIGAAACGGVATAPLVVGIIGWAHSWNVYTNLTYTLGSLVLWVALWKAWA